MMIIKAKGSTVSFPGVLEFGGCPVVEFSVVTGSGPDVTIAISPKVDNPPEGVQSALSIGLTTEDALELYVALGTAIRQLHGHGTHGD